MKPCWLVTVTVTEYVPGPRDTSTLPLTGVVRSVTGRVCCPVCRLLRGDADVEMEYWRVSSLVPGYMAVSWTVSPPAVGVRATCGVEGRPEREGEEDA